MAIEREVKLDAGPDFVLPDLAGAIDGATVTVVPPRHLVAAYYDTEDLRLARSGITVRYRTDRPAGSRSRAPGTWTVKLPAAAGLGQLARDEIDVTAPAGAIPAEVAALVRAHTRSAPLVKVAQLDTRPRQPVRLDAADGAPLVEVVLDDVVVDGTPRFRQVEAELAAGADPAVLAGVVARLRAAGATPAAPVSKLVQALGPRAKAPPEVVMRRRRRRSSAADAVQAALAAAVLDLLRHDPYIRSAGDDGAVAQAAGAVQRLAAALDVLQPFVKPSWRKAVTPELAWLGGVLVAARDADAVAQQVRRHALGLPAADQPGVDALLARTDRDRAAARTTLRRALDAGRYTRLLDTLVAATQAPPVTAKAPGQKAADAVRPIARAALARLGDGVGAAGLSDAPAAVGAEAVPRIEQVRAAVEAVGPADGDAAAGLLDALAEVADALARHQDAIAAESWLRSGPSRRAAGEALAAGQLLAALRVEQEEGGRRAAKAWRRVAKPRLSAWLD